MNIMIPHLVRKTAATILVAALGVSIVVVSPIAGGAASAATGVSPATACVYGQWCNGYPYHQSSPAKCFNVPPLGGYMVVDPPSSSVSRDPRSLTGYVYTNGNFVGPYNDDMNVYEYQLITWWTGSGWHTQPSGWFRVLPGGNQQYLDPQYGWQNELFGLSFPSFNTFSGIQEMFHVPAPGTYYTAQVFVWPGFDHTAFGGQKVVPYSLQDKWMPVSC